MLLKTRAENDTQHSWLPLLSSIFAKDYFSLRLFFVVEIFLAPNRFLEEKAIWRQSLLALCLFKHVLVG